MSSFVFPSIALTKIAQELYEKQKNFYRENYVEKNNYELLEDFPEWLDGIGLKILAPYFENMKWQEVMSLSTRNLIDMGIKNSNIRSLLIRHFWRSKVIHIKSKELILTQVQLNYRDRDFQMIGRDLAVDPYLLKDLKFCLNAMGYAYSNFAPFFYGKTWQEIIDMNVNNLWDNHINGSKRRSDELKKIYQTNKF
ncbi:2897_t:CDS:2 [Diversispora eburnea]|uniref:2897_t:CDS:1 n=1 Tax=Diversispora eburnea TaxID=1213867 RepID=A0A9N9FC47_9GLOM|nr:2897_t:CDS:2 [Diversispora eburnea]